MEGDWLQLLKEGGALAALVIFIVGCIRKWWVFGWQYEDLKKDRDEWKEVALSGTSLAEAAVDLAEKKRRSGK